MVAPIAPLPPAPPLPGLFYNLDADGNLTIGHRPTEAQRKAGGARAIPVKVIVPPADIRRLLTFTRCFA